MHGTTVKKKPLRLFYWNWFNSKNFHIFRIISKRIPHHQQSRKIWKEKDVGHYNCVSGNCCVFVCYPTASGQFCLNYRISVL